jgi:hypothetical protein
MIFCNCGQSLTVPWESTAEEPEVVPVLPVAPAAPQPPRMIPVPVGEERIPVVHPPRRPEPAYGRPQRRVGPVVNRDRNYCFNHQDLEVERTCESCAERFCAHCLVLFQGRNLCGPCKNARIKALDEPPKLSGLAVTAALLALALSLSGFCLLPMGAAMDVLPLVVFTLLLQLGTLGMAILALYRTEKTSLLRGKSLAITAVIAAAVGILLTVATMLYGYLQWV